jgi:hypothetical protein
MWLRKDVDQMTVNPIDSWVPPRLMLGRPRLDVDMSDATIFDMPMEFGLPLMAAISANLLNSKREHFDDIFEKVDWTLLIVPVSSSTSKCNTSRWTASALDCVDYV